VKKKQHFYITFLYKKVLQYKLSYIQIYEDER